MTLLVVDTNVLLYLTNASHVLRRPYETLLHGRVPVVSFQTVGEVYRQIRRLGLAAPRAARLEDHIRRCTYAPPTWRTCETWAALRQGPYRTHQDGGDAWVAATALELGCPVVTHNRRHFEIVPGLQVLSA